MVNKDSVQGYLNKRVFIIWLISDMGILLNSKRDINKQNSTLDYKLTLNSVFKPFNVP